MLESVTVYAFEREEDRKLSDSSRLRSDLSRRARYVGNAKSTAELTKVLGVWWRENPGCRYFVYYAGNERLSYDGAWVGLGGIIIDGEYLPGRGGFF